ncbi:unnamed protein product [Cylicocyclus nassatus]|uniref:Uncharacterized protein n=1 Tax=Cylicocyclus nassatus TaxID=53992 RepID=A0AA36GJV1_CYLNA|nr:unnamed protein product [Cylicocyclus nassatus]
MDLRIGILTKVARSFRHLSDILSEWKAIKSCYEQFQNGGRVITAWPPLIEKDETIWKNVVEMWTVLDETLANKGGPKQCITTANSKIKAGKVFCEKGTPEDCVYFYSAASVVANAKLLYNCIRKRVAKEVQLPELKPLPMRA